jgi:phosphatidylglycerophosphate synthase
MFDDVLRALKDRLLAPVARQLGPGLHPNVVSVVAFLVGAGAAVLAARRVYDAALALWALNRVLDGLDGTLARIHARQSDLGGYLDILLDFAVYALMPLALVVGAPTRENAIAGLYLVGTFFVNAASWMYLAAILERRAQGAAARGELTTVTMPPGLIAGAETVVFYSLFLLFPQHLAPLFTVMGSLVLVNVVQRFVWAARNL